MNLGKIFTESKDMRVIIRNSNGSTNTLLFNDGIVFTIIITSCVSLSHNDKDVLVRFDLTLSKIMNEDTKNG